MGADAEQRVFDAIDPAKDVDGFHPYNVGLLVQKRPALVACTPLGCIELLEREGIAMKGKHAVVIGRSDIVGKPMAMLLLHRDATVTICHSRTVGLAGDRQDRGHPGRGDRPARLRDARLRQAGRDGDRRRHQYADDARPRSSGCFAEGSRKRAAFAEKGSVLVGDVHPEVEEVAGARDPGAGRRRPAHGRDGAAKYRHGGGTSEQPGKAAM